MPNPDPDPPVTVTVAEFARELLRKCEAARDRNLTALRITRSEIFNSRVQAWNDAMRLVENVATGFGIDLAARHGVELEEKP
jgi:hypothetical protein